jgi:hypothetical protein
VHYPADWSAVADRVHGDVVVLPWGSYRRFAWAPGRSVLDPAPRLLPTPTVVDDRLVIGGTVLAGEDPRAVAVGRALRSGAGLADGLAAQGVGWVVVEHGTPGPVPDLSGLRLVYRGTDVSLYRVPGEIADVSPSAGRIAAVLAGDALAVLVLLVLAGWAVRQSAGVRHPRPVGAV